MQTLISRELHGMEWYDGVFDFLPFSCVTGVGKRRLSENYIAVAESPLTAFSVSLADGPKERRNECTGLCIF
jgi:hypothetical protein